MAEVIRRSFDLNSGGGLTDLLQAARKSTLDPTSYAQFRDLVLKHAQLKGSDPELKKKIESIAASLVFPSDNTKEESTVPTTEATPPVVAPQSAPQLPTSHGRRALPSFPVSKSATPSSPVMEKAQTLPVTTPLPIANEVDKVEVPVQVPVEEIKVEPKVEVAIAPLETPHIEAAPLKTVDEYKLRILEIKRHVNSLVGNPATLMDHGNTLGRDYMTALLGALKGTSPGSTQNIDAAMAALEVAYKRILNREKGDDSVVSEPEVVSVPVTLSVPEEIVPSQPAVSEEEEKDIEHTIPHVSLADFSAEPLPNKATEPETSVEDEINNEPLELPEALEPEEESPVEPAADLVPQNTHDEDTAALAAKETIAALRAQLREQDKEIAAVESAPQVSKPRRTLPSILDMAEDEIPSTVVEVNEVPTPIIAPPRPIPRSDMRALTERPQVKISGEGNPAAPASQAELFSAEVTDILKRILHDWNIFASSGLFGMGPNGFEHPLYEKISTLPMGEVLSGRFENANMKIVHVIKDYVDAWRHEQGVAYNPSETFEHYLRRVAERIQRRQKAPEKV